MDSARNLLLSGMHITLTMSLQHSLGSEIWSTEQIDLSG